MIYYLVLPLTTALARRFLPRLYGGVQIVPYKVLLGILTQTYEYLQQFQETYGNDMIVYYWSKLEMRKQIVFSRSFSIKPEDRERQLPKHDRINKIALEFH